MDKRPDRRRNRKRRMHFSPSHRNNRVSEVLAMILKAVQEELLPFSGTHFRHSVPEHQAAVSGFTESASDIQFNNLTIMEPPSSEQEQWRHEFINCLRKKRGDGEVDEPE
jgi:hypothetical protein